MKIFLIRHGETTSDVEDRFGGDYDDHLTEKGIAQTRALADKLAGQGIEKIYSSPFIRAKETSGILDGRIKCGSEVVPDIRERNSYGPLSGALKAEHAELLPRFKDYLYTLEGSEDYAGFTERIKRGFEYIAGQPYRTIAIVTHGGSIECLFRSIFGFGEFAGDIADCAVIELELDEKDVKIIKLEGASLSGSK